MTKENKFVSKITHHEEDIFLVILVIISALFFSQSLFSLEGNSTIFPMLFSGILLISSSLLFGYKFLSERFSQLQPSTDESRDQEGINQYPIILVSLMIIFLIVGQLVNLAAGAIVFVLLYSISRGISRRKTAALSIITLIIIYTFVALINSPIL